MKIRRLLSLALVCCMMMCCIPAAFASMEQPLDAVQDAAGEASTTQSDKAAIIATLQYIECDKEGFGLSQTDFSNLYIGDKIHAYEYTENGFEELNFSYPIFCGKEIVALATWVDEGNYQISCAFVTKFNEIKDSNIALVYDSDAAYVFDGANFALLCKSPVHIPTRKSFQAGYPDVKETDVVLCDLEESVKLDYVPAKSTREQTYFGCNVKYVSQGEGTNLCWAATIACINNYVHGTNLTAKDVAIEKYGPMDYDKGILTSECDDIMRDTYNLDYVHLNHVPSDTTILDNIRSGYPLYGSFWGSEGEYGVKHAATVYGINIVSGYISVMDPFPSAGWTTAMQKNGEYSYFCPTVGMTMTLDQTVCKIWD